MLYTYTSSKQTVAAGGSVVLESNGLTGNCAMINHTAGSTTITLKQGTYIINFNCDATSATTGALSF